MQHDKCHGIIQNEYFLDFQETELNIFTLKRDKVKCNFSMNVRDCMFTLTCRHCTLSKVCITAITQLTPLIAPSFLSQKSRDAVLLPKRK